VPLNGKGVRCVRNNYETIMKYEVNKQAKYNVVERERLLG